MILEEDDLMEIHAPMDFRSSITNKDIQTSSKVPLVVCYNLIDMGKTKYGFNQVFTEKDARMYFLRMKELSESTIYDLMDSKLKDWHFHSVKVSGNVKETLFKLHPNAAKGIYTIYQFALYTDSRGASRETGIRSPRIYFMLGKNGMVYPLFFDPYHELSPMQSL